MRIESRLVQREIPVKKIDNDIIRDADGKFGLAFMLTVADELCIIVSNKIPEKFVNLFCRLVNTSNTDMILRNILEELSGRDRLDFIELAIEHYTLIESGCQYQEWEFNSPTKKAVAIGCRRQLEELRKNIYLNEPDFVSDGVPFAYEDTDVSDVKDAFRSAITSVLS